MAWVPLVAAVLPSIISAFSKKGDGGGEQGKFKNVSLLDKNQMPLQSQLLKAGMQPGAGGAFGQSADYYRDLLSNNPQDFQQMIAPEMRRFNQDIIPGIAEQFAGMGSGGLSSSGFRNAAVEAGTDLSERLGAIRAQLRQQGAAGLSNIGQMGLRPTKENVYFRGQPGGLETMAPALGNLATQYSANWLNNRQQQTSQPIAQRSSPYGANASIVGGNQPIQRL